MNPYNFAHLLYALEFYLSIHYYSIEIATCLPLSSSNSTADIRTWFCTVK